MSMRLRKSFVLGSIGLLALSACTQPVPSSNPEPGVGFGDYSQYEVERAQRDALLRGETPDATLGSDLESGAITSSDLAELGIGEGTNGATPASTTPVTPNNPSISDEQDFEAVSSRESIESDAQRRAQQAAQYQVIEATAVPERTGAGGPNVVQYALQTTNSVGEPLYARSGFGGQNRYLRRCAEYGSPDAAQRDFLARGGPERDARGIDPDGDGFACGWNPAAYRVALQDPVAAAPAPDAQYQVTDEN